MKSAPNATTVTSFPASTNDSASRGLRSCYSKRPSGDQWAASALATCADQHPLHHGSADADCPADLQDTHPLGPELPYAGFHRWLDSSAPQPRADPNENGPSRGEAE